MLVDGDGEDSALLKRALAGMIDLMPASMALLAPNVNSASPLPAGDVRPDAGFVGGITTATVALRIPCGERQNHPRGVSRRGADA
ncbi:glutamine synthetase [Klebsiella pneumoniae subsp. pneumoniae]|nr:glutamine synthetase [Klebsiella pneumoniae subsp. pneumoniae]